MKLPVTLPLLSFLILTSCADNSVNKQQVKNNADRDSRVDSSHVVNNPGRDSSENKLSTIALNYLTKNSTELGINNAFSDLQLIKISKDEYQTSHLKYKQLYKNVPVWANELIVHIKNNNVYRVDGKGTLIKDNLSVIPKLPSKMAEQLAFEGINGEYDSQLMVLADDNKIALLTYLVKVNRGLYRYKVFVDANNGQVIKTLNAMPDNLQ